MVTMSMVTSTREQPMQTIKASEFKAKCLALMDEVARTGKTMVVTKNGKPVAELRAYTGKRPKSPSNHSRACKRRRAAFMRRQCVSPSCAIWPAGV